jgi:hypothetical protein
VVLNTPHCQSMTIGQPRIVWHVKSFSTCSNSSLRELMLRTGRSGRVGRLRSEGSSLIRDDESGGES